jgi:anti-sigma28 factor (negative regulator of flagellin synthesis)
MDSKKKQKIKIQLFNEYFKAMQKDIKMVLKKTSHPSFEATSYKDLSNFSLDMCLNIQMFDEKNVELLKKVEILDRFFSTKPSLSSQNIEAVWKYLELMLFVVDGKKRTPEKKMVTPGDMDLTKITSAMGSLMSDPGSGLSDLIESISSKLQTSLQGKEIDQQQLIMDLMSGNSSSSGINFGDIISQTTEALKEKIDSGEVDMSKLKEIADSMTK